MVESGLRTEDKDEDIRLALAGVQSLHIQRHRWFRTQVPVRLWLLLRFGFWFRLRQWLHSVQPASCDQAAVVGKFIQRRTVEGARPREPLLGTRELMGGIEIVPC